MTTGLRRRRKTGAPKLTVFAKKATAYSTLRNTNSFLVIEFADGHREGLLSSPERSSGFLQTAIGLDRNHVHHQRPKISR
jgi:hypothetical protein